VQTFLLPWKIVLSLVTRRLARQTTRGWSSPESPQIPQNAQRHIIFRTYSNSDWVLAQLVWQFNAIAILITEQTKTLYFDLTLEVWNLTKEMLGPSDRPRLKLKAKETEGMLDFVVGLLDFWRF
jgi:hypothetical protein